MSVTQSERDGVISRVAV